MWTSESVCGRRVWAGLLLLAGLASAGCVEHAMYAGNRDSDYDPIPIPPQSEPLDGAIWSGGTASGSFLFFDRKARGPGDLVTVLVVENVSAAGSATTSLDRTSSLGAELTSQLGFTELLQQGARKIFDLLGVANPGMDVAAGESLGVIDATSDSSFEGDGETTREGTFNAVVTCRVLEELPGGLFHIRGRRSIVVNHELQLLTVEGLVRREDITIRNTVPSTALAEARLTYDGIGVIDDKQRPSLFSRLMSWAYPF